MSIPFLEKKSRQPGADGMEFSPGEVREVVWDGTNNTRGRGKGHTSKLGFLNLMSRPSPTNPHTVSVPGCVGSHRRSSHQSTGGRM